MDGQGVVKDTGIGADADECINDGPAQKSIPERPRTIGHPTTYVPAHGKGFVGLRHIGGGWHLQGSPLILPLNLGQEGLNVVQIPPGFQSHLVGTGAIRPGSRRILHCLQSGTQGLINHLTEGLTKLCRNGFRLVQNIVV